ncbi:PhzF family phenazine biosynthesis protein [Guggenheimella bovis]
MTQYIIKAFNYQGQGGNTAAVVLEQGNPAEMQALAKANGYSETVFYDTEKKFARFFTPVEEVGICGHATLALFGVLKKLEIVEEGVQSFTTNQGTYQVDVREDVVFLRLDQPTFFPFEGEWKDEALGVKTKNVDVVSTGLKDILVEVESRILLHVAKPDRIYSDAIQKENDAIGYHVYTLHDGLHVRNFAPLVGIDEECATGTSNGALVSLLHKKNIVKTNEVVTIFQGEDMGEPSRIEAFVDEEGYPWVGGAVSI